MVIFTVTINLLILYLIAVIKLVLHIIKEVNTLLIKRNAFNA